MSLTKQRIKDATVQIYDDISLQYCFFFFFFLNGGAQ